MGKAAPKSNGLYCPRSDAISGAAQKTSPKKVINNSDADAKEKTVSFVQIELTFSVIRKERILHEIAQNVGRHFSHRFYNIANFLGGEQT